MGLRTRWTTAVAAVMVLGMIVAAPAQAARPNNAPVAVADTLSAVAGTEVRINPVLNDTDADPGDVLSLSGTPTLTSGSATVALVGADVSITPTPGTSTPLVVTYLVTDGKASTPGTITVNVLAPPPPPPRRRPHPRPTRLLWPPPMSPRCTPVASCRSTRGPTTRIPMARP